MPFPSTLPVRRLRDAHVPWPLILIVLLLQWTPIINRTEDCLVVNMHCVINMCYVCSFNVCSFNGIAGLRFC